MGTEEIPNDGGTDILKIGRFGKASDGFSSFFINEDILALLSRRSTRDRLTLHIAGLEALESNSEYYSALTK